MGSLYPDRASGNGSVSVEPQEPEPEEADHRRRGRGGQVEGRGRTRQDGKALWRPHQRRQTESALLLVEYLTQILEKDNLDN